MPMLYHRPHGHVNSPRKSTPEERITTRDPDAPNRAVVFNPYER
jgi:hypothetical protein